MIVGLKIINDFEIDVAEELVENLHKLGLLDLTLEEVKKAVDKEWQHGADWEDLVCDSDLIDFILKDLANGCFYWEYHDSSEKFTIYVVDPDKPFTKEGKMPKVKVKFD